MDNENPVQAEETPEVTAEDTSVEELPMFIPEPGDDDYTPPAPEEEPATEETPATEQQAATDEPGEVPAEAPLPEHVQRVVDDVQRREIELRQQASTIKQGEIAARELEELKQALRDPSKQLDAITRAGGDPSGAIEAILGPSEEEQQFASNPVVKKLMGEVNSLKEHIKTREQARLQETQQAQQARVYQEYTQVAADADPEQHPFLRAFADSYAPTVMFEEAVGHAQQFQAVPTTQQVAAKAEQKLKLQAEDLIERLRGIPHFASHFQPKGNGQAPAAPGTKAPPTGTTLRNQDSAESPPPVKEIKADEWAKMSRKDVVKHVTEHGPSMFDPD